MNYNLNLSTVNSENQLIESEHSQSINLDYHSPPKIVERFHSFGSESSEDLNNEEEETPNDSPLTSPAMRKSLKDLKTTISEKLNAEDLHNLFECSDIHDHHEHLMVRCTPPTPTLKHLSKCSLKKHPTASSLMMTDLGKNSNGRRLILLFVLE